MAKLAPPKKASKPTAPKKPTSRSKTGNAACSEAASNWQLSLRGKAALDPETYRTLAKCRSMNRTAKMAEAQGRTGKLSAMGESAVKARLQSRFDSGLITQKARTERLDMLLKQRSEKHAEAFTEAVRKSTPIKSYVNYTSSGIRKIEAAAANSGNAAYRNKLEATAFEAKMERQGEARYRLGLRDQRAIDWDQREKSLAIAAKVTYPKKLPGQAELGFDVQKTTPSPAPEPKPAARYSLGGKLAPAKSREAALVEKVRGTSAYRQGVPQTEAAMNRKSALIRRQTQGPEIPYDVRVQRMNEAEKTPAKNLDSPWLNQPAGQNPKPNAGKLAYRSERSEAAKILSGLRSSGKRFEASQIRKDATYQVSVEQRDKFNSNVESGKAGHSRLSGLKLTAEGRNSLVPKRMAEIAKEYGLATPTPASVPKAAPATPAPTPARYSLGGNLAPGRGTEERKALAAVKSEGRKLINTTSAKVGSSAFAFTSYSPEDRAKRLSSELTGSVRSNMRSQLKRASNAQDANVVLGVLKRHSGQIQSKASDYSRSQSRVASSAIVGPGRFNVRSNEKRSDSADKRFGEMTDYMGGLENAVSRELLKKSDVGSKINRLATARTRLESRKTKLNRAKSDQQRIATYAGAGIDQFKDKTREERIAVLRSASSEITKIDKARKVVLGRIKKLSSRESDLKSQARIRSANISR